MRKYLGRRSDDEVAQDILEAIGLPYRPLGHALYRYHRTAMSGLAFHALWVPLMTLAARTLHTGPVLTAMLLVPPILHALSCLRRPYAELMLVVLDGRIICARVTVTRDDDLPRVTRILETVQRVSGIRPEIAVDRRFPSVAYRTP